MCILLVILVFLQKTHSHLHGEWKLYHVIACRGFSSSSSSFLLSFHSQILQKVPNVLDPLFTSQKSQFVFGINKRVFVFSYFLIDKSRALCAILSSKAINPLAENPRLVVKAHG